MVVGLSSAVAESVTITTATFNGKNASYTEGWTTTGTGLNRTDCVVIGKGENITSPEFDFSDYEEVTITINARRYGTISNSKATINVTYNGTSVGTIDATGTNATTEIGSITFKPTSSKGTLVFTCSNASSAGSSHGAGINTIAITGEEKGDTPSTPDTPTSYTVSLANDIVGGSISADVTSAVAGATVSITATPAEGYKFSSWNITGATPASTTDASTTFTMPSSNVTVSATFEQETVTPVDENTLVVTYNFNDKDAYPKGFPTGGTNVMESATTFTISGNDIVIFAPNNYYTINPTNDAARGLFFGKTVASNNAPTSGTAYLGFPAKEGYKITKVEATTTSGVGGDIKMNIYNSSWEAFSTEVKTTGATKKTFTFELEKSSANAEYRLASGSSGKNLQFDNIVVTYTKTDEAPAATLSSIAISGTPTTTTYYEGDSFSTEGLVVTGTYSDKTSKEITTGITWTVTPATLTASTTSVSVVATANGLESAAYQVEGLTVNAIAEKTIAEFIASKGGKCYLTGIVSGIDNNTFGNYTLTDESGSIYVFGTLTPKNEKQKFNTLGVVEGDKIKVLADKYTLYNDETDEAINVVFVKEIAIEKAKYVVTIATPENGTIVVKNGEETVNNGDEVEEGTVLSLTATPAENYKLSAWSVTDAEGKAVEVSSNTFSMPAYAVSVSATFEELPEEGDIVTLTYNFNDPKEFPANFPTKSGTTATAQTFEISGNPLIINAKDGYYIFGSTTVNCGLFLGKTSNSKGNPQDDTSYLGFPAKKGYKLTKVVATTSVNAAADVPINIYDKDYNEMSTSIKTESSTKKVMEFVLSKPKENTSYRLTASGSSGKNFNFDNIVLTYEKVEVPTSYELTISAAEYATYYDSENAYVMPDDCEGYVFTVKNGLESAYEGGDVVPAGEPLVIYTIEPGTKTLTFTTSEEETYKSGDMNDLEGTDEETALEEDATSYFYALSLDKDGKNIGFYWMNATGAAFTNGAHKAYLKAAKSTVPEVRGFAFNGATAIKAITTSSNDKIYDLTGREVKSAKTGLYIVNGVKKYIK